MKLSEVVPWGRSFGEYVRMFALTADDLRGRVLGCADGPASFNLEAAALGHDVVSCDPIYVFSGDEIGRRVEACCDTVVGFARQNAHRFIWNDFRDPDDLGRSRLAAMRQFLADFEQGRATGRYIAAALPHLPFADHQFNVCVCSHLLFLYSERLDLAFHLAAVREMLRVAAEVRVFPLLDLNGRASPFVEPVRSTLGSEGWRVAIRKVPYEFQKGGDQLLVVREK